MMATGRGYPAIPTVRWARRAVLAAILLDLALVGGLVLHHRPLLAQPGGARYVAEPVIALLLYAGLGAWATAAGDPPRRRALCLGVAVGLLTGALWLVNLTLETFTDLGDRVGLLATAPFLLGAFVLWGLGGFLGAWRTRSIRLGILAAVLAALLCVLGTVTYGFLLAYTALPRLERNLAADPDYLRSGWGDVRAFAIANTFDAGFSHLLLAPLIAALVGGVGAGLGRGWGARIAGADPAPQGGR